MHYRSAAHFDVDNSDLMQKWQSNKMVESEIQRVIHDYVKDKTISKEIIHQSHTFSSVWISLFDEYYKDVYLFCIYTKNPFCLESVYRWFKPMSTFIFTVLLSPPFSNELTSKMSGKEPFCLFYFLPIPPHKKIG